MIYIYREREMNVLVCLSDGCMQGMVADTRMYTYAHTDNKQTRLSRTQNSAKDSLHLKGVQTTGSTR
jgi:hypothetical protein